MKTLGLSLICLIFPFLVNAQYDIEKAKKDSARAQKVNLYHVKQNIFVGSSLNLLFGQTTFIYLSPQIGYDFNRYFSLGIQGLYQYYRFPISNSSSFSTNAVSGGVFARFRPIKNLSLETSFNLYNTNQISPFITGDRVNTRSLLVGLSYNRLLGERAFSFFSVYYNFIRDFNTPEPILFSNFDNSFYLHYKIGLVLYPFGN